MLIIRTGLSESGAFEIAYNVTGRRIPMFFAIWHEASIKTTLLQELEDRCEVEYHTFEAADELQEPLRVFLESALKRVNSKQGLEARATT